MYPSDHYCYTSEVKSRLFKKPNLTYLDPFKNLLNFGQFVFPRGWELGPNLDLKDFFLILSFTPSDSFSAFSSAILSFCDISAKDDSAF
jgi:hypothetical protein